MFWFLVLLLTPAAEATEFSFVGTFGQEAILRQPGSSEERCRAPNETWDPGLKICFAKLENRIAISSSPEGKRGAYFVEVRNAGATGTFCELQFEMKRSGKNLVLAGKLTGQPKGYRLEFAPEKTGINVIEDLGQERGTGASPGCGPNAFVSGNGQPFARRSADEPIRETQSPEPSPAERRKIEECEADSSKCPS